MAARILSVVIAAVFLLEDVRFIPFPTECLGRVESPELKPLAFLTFFKQVRLLGGEAPDGR